MTRQKNLPREHFIKIVDNFLAILLCRVQEFL